MKKLLLLLIIPFLSFGQCEDPNACNFLLNDYYEGGGYIVNGVFDYEGNYYVPNNYNEFYCQYEGDFCATTLGELISDEYADFYQYQYNSFYTWDENCECSPPPGCQDNTACNYGQGFDGWEGVGSYIAFNTNSLGDPVIFEWNSGAYESAPYCLLPGDSCNVFNESAVLPGPLGYSGVLNNDCACICTNSENIWTLGGQNLTYVPDDAFEEYIETTFINANNGIPNDNYVLTEGIQSLDGAPYQITLSENTLNDPIFDLTGIEDFRNVSSLSISYQNISNIDLSTLTTASGNLQQISVNACPLLEQITLPSDTISYLYIGNNQSLSEIISSPDGFYRGQVFIQQNLNLCELNLQGSTNDNFYLRLELNTYLLQIDLSQLNTVYGVAFNLSTIDPYQVPEEFYQRQIKFNDAVYDWTSVQILTFSTISYPCVDVSDPNYCELAWGEFVNYETNCFSAFDCENLTEIMETPTLNKRSNKTIDILGRQTTNKGFQLQIYDDGSVEKKYLIK